MKSLLLWSGMPILLTLILLFFSGCSTPDDAPINKDPGQNDEEKPDALLETLIFSKSTKVTGTVPSVVNTSLLKTNTRDTIYAVPGAKFPIRISHPEATLIQGIFIAVQQGTFYYDVPKEREEESDTVSVILLEIDPGDVEQPYQIPVEIIPYDMNHSPVDKIERIISVEPPAGNGCGILVDRPSTLGDTSGVWSPEWFWFSTMVFNHANELVFLNAPGNASITETQYQGCCDPNRPQGKCHPLSTTLNATVNARIVYTIENETFTFFTNGTFARQTFERKQNFNPETTDWCSGSAGYKREDVVVTYFGNHDYVPGNKSITYGTTYANCDLCGYGSRGGDLTNTCHLMIISRGTENSREQRIYVRNSVSNWYE